MMTCCKEKVVLVAVYKEKPGKRSLISRNNDIKHHHHHHHHHLHVHPTNSNKGDRRAELLSYSQRLRKSSNLKASTPPRHPRSSVSSTTNDRETSTQVHDDRKKQKLKKGSSLPDMKSVFKCFAMSQAKKKMKRRKKKSSISSSNKANVMMKRFASRTRKGVGRFFSKLNAFIQKHR